LRYGQSALGEHAQGSYIERKVEHSPHALGKSQWQDEFGVPARPKNPRSKENRTEEKGVLDDAEDEKGATASERFLNRRGRR